MTERRQTPAPALAHAAIGDSKNYHTRPVRTRHAMTLTRHRPWPLARRDRFCTGFTSSSRCARLRRCLRIFRTSCSTSSSTSSPSLSRLLCCSASRGSISTLWGSGRGLGEARRRRSHHRRLDVRRTECRARHGHERADSEAAGRRTVHHVVLQAAGTSPGVAADRDLRGRRRRGTGADLRPHAVRESPRASGPRPRRGAQLGDVRRGHLYQGLATAIATSVSGVVFCSSSCGGARRWNRSSRTRQRLLAMLGDMLAP